MALELTPASIVSYLRKYEQLVIQRKAYEQLLYIICVERYSSFTHDSPLPCTRERSVRRDKQYHILIDAAEGRCNIIRFFDR